MLQLKLINKEDAKKEYDFITNQPADENGMTNDYFNISWEKFLSKALPELIDYARGENLPEGYVPESFYFLWDDDIIVGLFRIRHYLVESLINGAGHIGFCIKKEYRGKGYATKGLALAIEEAKKCIVEDEIYFRVRRNNVISQKVQMSNGAYIHHDNEQEIFARIKIK